MIAMVSEPQTLYEISTVARRLGVATETIRAWERRKLIAPPRRTATGTRLYTEADVETMRLAQRARGSGSASSPAVQT